MYTDELLAEYARTRSIETRDAIITHNQGLVYHAVKGRTWWRVEPAITEDDVIPAGLEGLARAVCTFDLQSGNSFSRYASVCIHQAIRDWLRTVRFVSAYGITLRNKYHAARERLMTRLGYEPTPDELRAELNLSRSKFRTVHMAARAASSPHIHFSALKYHGAEIAAEEHPPSYAHPSLFADVIPLVGDTRMEDILLLRYRDGVETPVIMARYNLTRSEVNHLVSQGLGRIRARLKKQGKELSDFL